EMAGVLPSQSFHDPVGESDEAHHHASPRLRTGRRPRRLHGGRILDDGANLVGRGERHAGLHGAGAGVEHVGDAATGRLERLSAYEMGDVTGHCVTLLWAVFGTVTMVVGPQGKY